MDRQKTIAKSVSIKGVGLHTGNKVNLTFKPAAADSGINFIRTDLKERPAIKVSVENLQLKEGSLRCSHLEKDGIKIYTIEHLLAALSGLGIDNLEAEIDNCEVPGGDGSSQDFVELLAKAGICEQEKERDYCLIREPVFIAADGASIVALPAQELKISYTLDYRHPYIKSDFMEISVDAQSFKKELAPARTFCLEEEVAELKRQGLGKGADYENSLVVGKDGVINNRLRYADEFIRHKILDLLGDLYTLGRPLKAHIIALKSGHSLNTRLVKKIFQPRHKLAAAMPGQEIQKDTIPGESLDINAIMKILPHRQPFLFVDRILHLEKGRRAVGIKNLTINDYFFAGHFPGRPVMPGVILLEAMAQVGGVMLLAQEENRGKIAYFMSINNAKFRKVVLPGDQVVFEVSAVKIKSRTGQVQAKASVDGVLAAEADMMFVLGDS